MFKWMSGTFTRKNLDLNDDEQQTLAQYSMMGGAMALTVAIGLLVWVLRYSWPEAVVLQHAATLMDYLFKIVMAFIALQAIQTIAQAVIAIGGKMKASAFGATVEAEVIKEVKVQQ